MSGFTPLLFAYVFAAVFLAGIVRGATGFGFSMIMIVLLTLFFPPAQVAPVILFWEVLASIGHLPFVYRQVHWKSLRWLALGVALGTPFGVYCLVSIPVDAMRLIINAVVLILTSMLYCGLRPKNAPTPPQTTGVGLLAGIINGASANGGPPIILFFLSSPLGAAVGRASLIAFFLFTDVWASLFYWQQGLISLDTVIFTLVFMVPMFGGMWFGNRWFSTVDEARFRKVVLALLMLISIVGLVKARSSLPPHPHPSSPKDFRLVGRPRERSPSPRQVIGLKGAFFGKCPPQRPPFQGSSAGRRCLARPISASAATRRWCGSEICCPFGAPQGTVYRTRISSF